MENIEKLPRFIMNVVNYQLTIHAWKSEWTIVYQWGTTDILGEAVAHGDTIDESAQEMIFLFTHHDKLKQFQHLLKNGDSVN